MPSKTRKTKSRKSRSGKKRGGGGMTVGKLRDALNGVDDDLPVTWFDYPSGSDVAGAEVVTNENGTKEFQLS